MTASIECMHMLNDGMHPSAFHANSDKDTLLYVDMLQAEDMQQFIEAMKKELNGFIDVLEVVHWWLVPADYQPLSTVWALKRKNLPDCSISKWKAHPNVHGGRQQHSSNYWDMFAPVVLLFPWYSFLLQVPLQASGFCKRFALMALLDAQSIWRSQLGMTLHINPYPPETMNYDLTRAPLKSVLLWFFFVL